MASTDLIDGEYKPLTKRGITEATCRHFGYTVGEYGGKPVHIEQYREDGQIVAQHLRFPNKDFIWLGEKKKAGLFGKHLWGEGGKKVVITEGAIDAMSVSQLQGNKWPVVSITSGAQGGKNDITKDLDWLESFEEVIFMFDMDEPGQKAARECADLITPGKAKIASLPLKDANEVLLANRGDEVINAIWRATVHRPDGIVKGDEIDVKSLQEPIAGYNLRLPKLNEMIGGIREGEITMLTAGSGIGKSTLAREVAYALRMDYELTIGNIYLEESNKKTAQAYIAIHNNVPLGKLRKDATILTDEQWAESHRDVNHSMYFYDHFGSLESDHLLAKIRYLRVALGCAFVVLDHISIVVSGSEGSGEGERRDIDKLMTKLRSLVEQTGVGIIAIVHLRQPEGTPHEEGGRVTLSQLRGSGSLKQLSDNVIALERDQQAEEGSDLSTVRVLKCREYGEVGVADILQYNRDTGRLLPTDKVATMFKDETGEPDF
jgi:twinkle protein